MTKQVIILLGLPGSGKGTQGAILSKKLMIPHISTGDILRKMALCHSDDSKILADRLSSGQLVSDDVVNKIVAQFLQSDECVRGCILDGYPRTLEQAKYLIENIDVKIIVIFLDLDDDIAVKRILGRFTCNNCGRLYNRYLDRPKLDRICDDCNSNEFSFRSDDDQDIVVSRIETYRRDTLPLVEYYKKKVVFFTVNAGRSKQKVVNDVASIVKNV